MIGKKWSLPGTEPIQIGREKKKDVEKKKKKKKDEEKKSSSPQNRTWSTVWNANGDNIKN